jgi:hypothetical protein
VARWEETLKGSARDLLAEAEATGDPEEQSELDEAVDWLRALLANGPAGSKEIRSDAKQAGIAWRTIERAKTRLGVKASKASFSGGWRWSLPDHSDPEDDPQPSQDPTQQNIGGLGGLGKSESLEPRCGAGSTEDRQYPEDDRQNRGVGGLGQNPSGARVPGDRDAEDRQDRQRVGYRGALDQCPVDEPDLVDPGLPAPGRPAEAVRALSSEAPPGPALGAGAVAW